MHDLKTTKAIVRSILEEDAYARNSDYYLYLKVLERTAAKKDIDLRKITVPHFLMQCEDMGFAHFETVRRTRQKLQQHFPEYAPCEEVEALRLLNEIQYKNYVRDFLC